MTLLERGREAFLRTISGYFRLLIVSMALIGTVLFSVFTYSTFAAGNREISLDIIGQGSHPIV